MELRISQSLIKQFLKRGEFMDHEGQLYYCPRKVYELYIANTVPQLMNLSMEKGKFFETLAIGSGRDGEMVLDLPRKKNGEKTTDQIRIEDQALVFKQVAHKYCINLDNIQKEYMIEWDRYRKEFPNVIISGNIDIAETPFNFNGTIIPRATIDLKLTSNIHSTHGDFCWGNPRFMDHTQAYMYYLLTELPFFYLIFDYKPNPEWKYIHVKDNAITRRELHESIRKTCERIKYHSIHGWETEAEYKRCKDCPINFQNGGDCRKADNVEII